MFRPHNNLFSLHFLFFFNKGVFLQKKEKKDVFLLTLTEQYRNRDHRTVIQTEPVRNLSLYTPTEYPLPSTQISFQLLSVSVIITTQIFVFHCLCYPVLGWLVGLDTGSVFSLFSPTVSSRNKQCYTATPPVTHSAQQQARHSDSLSVWLNIVIIILLNFSTYVS